MSDTSCVYVATALPAVYKRVQLSRYLGTVRSDVWSASKVAVKLTGVQLVSASKSAVDTKFHVLLVPIGVSSYTRTGP